MAKRIGKSTKPSNSAKSSDGVMDMDTWLVREGLKDVKKAVK